MKKIAHIVHQSQCSVTLDKNHQRCIRGLIDETTTDAGGTESEGVTYKWIGEVLVLCKRPGVFKMTATAFLIAAALLGHARAAVVELSCSDNATCFENLANDFVRSVRQQKTVRLFDTLMVEPLRTRQARSNEGLLERIFNNNAFSFDWNDYTFRIWKDQDRDDGALDLEVWESRTVKDVSEEIPKKSKSKVEEEEEEEDVTKQTPQPKPNAKGPFRRRRRAKKKIMQAVIPMLFGMKSSAAIIFAMGLVSVLTMKAYVASKLALMVTVGMAMKRLYESYTMGGLGLTSGIPEALWNLARYFRILFGLPPISPLSAGTMPMPMYVMPQMYGQMGQVGQATQIGQQMALPMQQMQ